MNYYEPLQRQTDKCWDYTQRRDGRTWPIGYCRGWTEDTRDELVKEYGEDRGEMFYKAQEERRAHQDCYHKDGHESSEEACECYKNYLLDHDVRLDGGGSVDTQHRGEVEGCDAWTQKSASVGPTRRWNLCDDHRNLETVRGLFTVYTSFGSY